MMRPWEPATEPATPEPDAVLLGVLAEHAGQLEQVARWPPGNRPWFMTRPVLTLLPQSVLPAGCPLFDLVPAESWYVDPDHGLCLVVGLNGAPCRSIAEMSEWTGWYCAGQADALARAREVAEREDGYRSEEARKALARQRELERQDAARGERDRLASPALVAELERRLDILEQRGGHVEPR